MKKTRRLWFVAAAILLALLLLSYVLFFNKPSLPLQAPPPDSVLLEAARSLDTIEIEAVFHPEDRTLSLHQRLYLTHSGEAARNDIVLRAYPNAFQQQDTSPVAIEEWYDTAYPEGFSMGALSIISAEGGLAGEKKQPLSRRYLDAAKTTLYIPLPFSWEPQSTLTLDISYTLHLPKAAGRYGVSQGIWTLGNAFLIPAPYENNAYRTDFYEPLGDPLPGDFTNYTLRLSVPEEYVCAASAPGITSSCAKEGGNILYTFQGYALREFALALSENYHIAENLEGNVLIRSYATDKETARKLLTYARQAISCFSSRYGAYPYPSFSLAQAHLPIEGVSYPGLVLIADKELTKPSLEWLAAELTAQQWWFAAVGSDPIYQPWQHEALSEYSLLDYIETYYGIAQRESLTFSRIETALRITIPRGVTPGSPLSYFENHSEYLQMVRHRGAALFCALREALGDRLDDFLRAYYDKYRFSKVSREDMETLLKSFSKEDWSPLFVDFLDTYPVQ